MYNEFLFPDVIYFGLQLFRIKDEQDGRPIMPYFNNFHYSFLNICKLNYYHVSVTNSGVTIIRYYLKIVYIKSI